MVGNPNRSFPINHRVALVTGVVILLALATGAAVSSVAAQSATVSASSAAIPNSSIGDTGNSSITVDTTDGLASADIEVSVNTSVATVKEVRKGADLEALENTASFNFTEFNTSISGGGGSAQINYTNIQSNDTVNFELAVVEFELTTSDEPNTTIGLKTNNFKYLNDTGSDMNYSTVDVNNGSIIESLFTGPLDSSFVGRPQNTGELDPVLYEDLDGDGDGLEIDPAITLFGKIFRRNLNGKQGLGLTSQQAEKLDWNPDSPQDTVTIGDMIELFGQKFRSQL